MSLDISIFTYWSNKWDNLLFSLNAHTQNQSFFKIFYICSIYVDVYLFILERQSAWVNTWAEGEWENLKQTPCWVWSPTRGSISQPQDHDQSWKQELDA